MKEAKIKSAHDAFSAGGFAESSEYKLYSLMEHGHVSITHIIKLETIYTQNTAFAIIKLSWWGSTGQDQDKRKNYVHSNLSADAYSYF